MRVDPIIVCIYLIIIRVFSSIQCLLDIILQICLHVFRVVAYTSLSLSIILGGQSLTKQKNSLSIYKKNHLNFSHCLSNINKIIHTTQYSNKIIMNRLKTWSQVVQEIETSSLQPAKQKTEEDLLMKHMYKNILIDQISQKKSQHSIEASNQRNRDLLQIRENLAKEQEQNNKQRIMKRQREHNYKEENLKILGERQKIHQKERELEIQQFKANPQNPFVSLVDQQDKRVEEYRKRQKIQGQINHKLERQHQDHLKTLKQEQKRKGKQWQQYIEGRVAKREQQREQYVYKYLKNPVSNRHQKNYSNIEGSDSLTREYLNYTNNIRSHKTNNDEIDITAEKINQNLKNQTNSPAYLGRIVQNSDRKRQLMIISRNLGIKPDQLQAMKPYSIPKTLDQQIPTSPSHSGLLAGNKIQYQPYGNNLEMGRRSELINYPRYNILTHKREQK